jgi:hypothetical protein
MENAPEGKAVASKRFLRNCNHKRGNTLGKVVFETNQSPKNLQMGSKSIVNSLATKKRDVSHQRAISHDKCNPINQTTITTNKKSAVGGLRKKIGRPDIIGQLFETSFRTSKDNSKRPIIPLALGHIKTTPSTMPLSPAITKQPFGEFHIKQRIAQKASRPRDSPHLSFKKEGKNSTNFFACGPLTTTNRNSSVKRQRHTPSIVNPLFTHNKTFDFTTKSGGDNSFEINKSLDFTEKVYFTHVNLK